MNTSNNAISSHKELLRQKLIEELKKILEEDQKYRKILHTIKNEKEKKILWDKIARIDKQNLKSIESIINTHGYPGKSKVGDLYSCVAFLVIQHAELAIQEKYFPIIEQAAKDGELKMSSLALLIDRMRMHKGEKQVYGSQIEKGDNGKRKIYDIEDENNVNQRRASVGLMPLEEYVKEFGIEYHPPQ